MKLTYDYTHHYTAVNGFCAHARVRAFGPEKGEPGGPVVIMTDTGDGPSVTNNVEVIASSLCSELGFDPGGVTFIEHYPPRDYVRGETFDRVTFSPASPQQVMASGRWVSQLGEPGWRPMDKAGVEALVGVEL